MTLGEYIRGHGNLLSQWGGWFTQWSNNGNESISAASWRRAGPDRETVDSFAGKLYRFINRIFYKQENHCAEAVWNDAAWSREHLEMLDHIVLDPQRAAEYREWLESRERKHEADSNLNS